MIAGFGLGLGFCVDRLVACVGYVGFCCLLAVCALLMVVLWWFFRFVDRLFRCGVCDCLRSPVG